MDRNPKDFCEGVADCARRLVEDRLSALAALFDLTAQRLVRYSAAITGNQHDAEDAAQAFQELQRRRAEWIRGVANHRPREPVPHPGNHPLKEASP